MRNVLKNRVRSFWNYVKWPMGCYKFLPSKLWDNLVDVGRLPCVYVDEGLLMKKISHQTLCLEVPFGASSCHFYDASWHRICQKRRHDYINSWVQFCTGIVQHFDQGLWGLPSSLNRHRWHHLVTSRLKSSRDICMSSPEWLYVFHPFFCKPLKFSWN